MCTFRVSHASPCYLEKITIVSALYNAAKFILNQGLEKLSILYTAEISGTYVLLMVFKCFLYHPHDHCLAGLERGA